MHRLLDDLYGHQAWADAEHWRALEACPPALADEAIRRRLHHIHFVQRAFLAVVTGESADRRRAEDFETPGALKAWAREYHERAVPLVRTLDEEHCSAPVTIPWFRDSPVRPTAVQALVQAAMHSHYHRAQNATRLRELGGAPPVTDLILWWWKDRPHARWE